MRMRRTEFILVSLLLLAGAWLLARQQNIASDYELLAAAARLVARGGGGGPYHGYDALLVSATAYGSDWRHWQAMAVGFAYPLPAVALAMPFAWLPAGGLLFNGTGLAALAVLLYRRGSAAILLLFPAVFGSLMYEQPSLPVAALVGWGLYAQEVRRPTLALAMVALAAVVKPQLALPALLWLVAVAAHRRQWAAVLRGSIPAVVAVAVAVAAQPDWIVEMLAAMRRYSGAIHAMWLLPWLAPLLAWQLVRRPWRSDTLIAALTVAALPVNALIYSALPLLWSVHLSPARQIALVVSGLLWLPAFYVALALGGTSQVALSLPMLLVVVVFLGVSYGDNRNTAHARVAQTISGTAR